MSITFHTLSLMGKERVRSERYDPEAGCRIYAPFRGFFGVTFRLVPTRSPFRWHSESSTSDIQSCSELLEARATPDRLSRALHCNANGGRRNQMYRNDLCTWLDILSPRHAWPPIATSLPVAQEERRTADRKQFHIHLLKSPFGSTPALLCCCVLLIFHQISHNRTQVSRTTYSYLNIRGSLIYL